MPCIDSVMMHRKTKILIGLGVLAVVAIALRIASPYFVETYVNRTLADMGGYRGHVEDVDLALIRGGYTLHDLTVVKKDGKIETPFVEMQKMDLSLQWKAIFRGEVVGEVVMHDPIVNLVTSKSDDEEQLGTGVNWPQVIRDLFPFQLNLVQVVDGLVTFRAPGIQAEESLTVRDFDLMLRNLKNTQDKATEAFADLEMTGRVMGNAPLKLSGQIDPNEAKPTFDIDLSLEQAKLVDVNPWIEEFLKVDAQAGSFSLFSEVAAADGRFEGYLRPIMENPEFFDPDADEGGPFRKAWEAFVGFTAKVLENREADQVATQIPLSGEFENPDADILATLVNLLRNAFVSAFAHSLAGTITLGDVSDDVAAIDDAAGVEASAGEGDQSSRQERRQERREARDERQEERQKNRE